MNQKYYFVPVYLPVSATSGQGLISLFATVGMAYAASLTNTSMAPGVIVNYKWNIKIQQINCKVDDPLQGDFSLRDIETFCIFTASKK